MVISELLAISEIVLMSRINKLHYVYIPNKMPINTQQKIGTKMIVKALFTYNPPQVEITQISIKNTPNKYWCNQPMENYIIKK